MKKTMRRVSIIISILLVLMKERRRICHLAHWLYGKLRCMLNYKEIKHTTDMIDKAIRSEAPTKVDYHPEPEHPDECIICE